MIDIMTKPRRASVTSFARVALMPRQVVAMFFRLTGALCARGFRATCPFFKQICDPIDRKKG
jgi:hypothetical protein